MNTSKPMGVGSMFMCLIPLLFTGATLGADDFTVGIRNSGGAIQVIVPPSTADYYRTYFATGMVANWRLTNMVLGAASNLYVNLGVDPAWRVTFIHAVRLARVDPGDGDADGLDDVFELTKTGFNPLSSADAAQDFDLDGISNLAEYLAQMDPLDYDAQPQIVIHNPRDGDWLP